MYQTLLLIGIVSIIASVVGGGLDAAGIIKFPQLRSWRTPPNTRVTILSLSTNGSNQWARVRVLAVPSGP
jgi:hypothetical protein